MKFIKPIMYVAWLSLIMLVSSCSSHVPPEIKQTLDSAPSVDQVRNNADTYLSQKVRWGGVILNTENKDKTSWLTIVAFPLDDSGEPQVSDQSQGRFIAIIDEFLEPLVYSREREITVIGNLLRTESLEVGEFSYEYPVIQAEHYYLWPAREEPTYIDYPPYWWYDPWYYPWYYPHYPLHYPYYPHRYHH